jgi:uncharacterized protein (TIGR00369 family)
MADRFPPVDPDFATRVRESFARQPMMQTFGAELLDVRAGEVGIAMPFNPTLTQQHGFLHAGAVTTLVDNACGYAAYSLMPANSEVLTIEFKVNFMQPARGERFVAVGKVLKSGRTVTVCNGEVIAINGQEETTVAVMQATMMTLA